MPTCLRLFCDWARMAAIRARAITGSRNAASSARIASSTSSWYSVKPRRRGASMGEPPVKTERSWFAAKGPSEVVRDDLPVGARVEQLPGLGLHLEGDRADAAVAEGDVDDLAEGAQRRQAAGAAAVDVGPLVVGPARGGVGALEEAAVEPAGAAVRRD